MMIPGTQDLQLIVELSEPSVLERMKGSLSSKQLDRARPPSERNRPIDFTSANARAYRQQVREGQQTVRNRILEFPGAQVLGTTNAVMNAVIVRVHATHYDALRRLPGVKKVYFSRPQRMLLDQAAIIQNAQALWTAAGSRSTAGHGIKIGLVDTGIDITNPMFSSTGFTYPSGFPKYDTTTDRNSYTNSKVIVARNYISLLSNSQSVQDARDEVGHGTFVAGCAAGEPVSAPRVLSTISGMAPGAFLGNYKVFGTPGTNDSTTTAAIVAAIDDAVNDGMNVINLSLGSLDYLPPEDDEEAIAVENAANAGVVVTIAAGNDGPATHSIDSPGVQPNAITVGSVTNSREFLAVLTTTDPDLSTIGYLPSYDGPAVTSSPVQGNIVDIAESLDPTGLGCSSFPPGSLSGFIALVERGTCTFATKVSNVVAAGGKAAVIYNNLPASLVNMSGLGGTTIPAVMISQNDGLALKQYIDAHPGTQVTIENSQTIQAVSTTARMLSSFSSVGPGTDFSVKPDVVAVGENVYSATEKTSSSGDMYDSSGFTVSQGTSFSTPMVAGAAASLRQLFPSLGALAIKSLITTTASRNLTVDGTNPPNVLEAGSGLLDMGNASAAGAVFSPTSLNFGVHSYSGSLSLPATLTIQNISSIDDQFTLAVEPIVDGPVISFSQNSPVAIAAGQTAPIDISLQVSAPNSGGFQGFITVQSASSSTVYRIPYWAGLYVPDSTRVLQVSQTATNGGYTNLADAIAAANPGNIIEIEDSASYPAGSDGLVISTNGQGLPLHGITIRAATGQTPVIDGTSLASSGNPANIQIVGLQNVLLQGLIINSGYTGIELYQPSPTVPLSVTIDHCTISNSFGDTGAAGVYIDGGGTIAITQSTISGSSGTGIVAGAFADGTQLTLFNTTVQGNGYDGIDMYGSNVDIFNSTFSANYGAGIYLDYCTGTIQGSTFTQNRNSSYYGDGIDIADGNVTVKNNLFKSNESDAISLFSGDLTGLGPTVQIQGNTMSQNGFYGIDAYPSPSLHADSNLIEDNAGGIYLGAGTTNSGFSTAGTQALLRNNIIVRSTDYYNGYGNGVEVDSRSIARLVNNTIYQNAAYGVVYDSGTVNIVNSIVYGNYQGNLYPVSLCCVQSSLTSSTNPQFVNPALNDFSLASSSPAIDAGSNTAADLPFLDYSGRLRVASAGVDMGAIESNSTYPQIYPLVLNGSEPSFGESFDTGIVMFTPSTSAQTINFTAYDSTGNVISGWCANPASVMLNGTYNNCTYNNAQLGNQLAILNWQLFGFDINAAAFASSLSSSASSFTGFYLISDAAFSQFASGANASSQADTDVVFTRHESDSAGQTRYVVYNPGVNTANITATLYDSTGTSRSRQSSAIQPNGNVVLNFDSANLSSGYVRVQSDRPVSGVEAVENTNFLSALGGFSPNSEEQLFFPHYAVGGGYTTRIGIVNTSASTANLTLRAYDEAGNLLDTNTSYSLPANGQLLDTVTNIFGISDAGYTQTGYIVAQGDQPGIMGFVDFSFNDGTHVSDAALPADSVPHQRLFFSHIAQGIPTGTGVPYDTGIALLNPFGTPVNYTLTVYGENDNVLAQTTGTLGPHQKIARILNYQLPGYAFFTDNANLQKVGNGHIEVTTDYGLIGLELFFADDLSQLASVPAQTGD